MQALKISQAHTPALRLVRGENKQIVREVRDTSMSPSLRHGDKVTCEAITERKFANLPHGALVWVKFRKSKGQAALPDGIYRVQFPEDFSAITGDEPRTYVHFVKDRAGSLPVALNLADVAFREVLQITQRTTRYL